MPNGHLNIDAEQYISKLLDKNVPYTKTIMGIDFTIDNKQVYAPGKLTTMFASYLIDNNLIENKNIVDLGAGCSSLGIIAAKYKAKKVIGLDISLAAVECSKKNIIDNNVQQIVDIILSGDIGSLLADYRGKIDLLISGPPWDSISSSQFEEISFKRQNISRAFYDVDDQLIINLLTKGKHLLNRNAQLLITSALRIMPKIKDLLQRYKVDYQIVKEEDIHKDGNIHYILKLI